MNVKNASQGDARIQTGTASDSLTAPSSEQRGTHTPTPWSYGSDGVSGVYFIPEINDLHYVSPHGLPLANEANAAFIVTACNAHADLLNALRDVYAFVGVMFGRGPDAVIPHTLYSPLGVPIKIGEIMRDAAAALAKAEGR